MVSLPRGQIQNHYQINGSISLETDVITPKFNTREGREQSLGAE